MTSGIYYILCLCSDRAYVGSSKNIERRFDRHKYELNNNSHHNIFLQRAWNKYGPEQFKFLIIEECYDDIFELEQEYLNNIPDGYYNIGKSASGGDNISRHPNREDIVARIRASLNEKISLMTEEERREKWGRIGDSNPNYGNKWNDEQRAHMSRLMMGVYRGGGGGGNTGPSYRKGKTFDQLFDEETATRLKTSLSKAAKKRIGEKNSFYGKRHSDATKKKISNKNKGKYRGSQEKKVLIEEKEYRSVSEAARRLNVAPATIINRIRSSNPKFKFYEYL